MSNGPARVVLLGSHSGVPTGGPSLDELGLDGPVATVRAGWQEWEGEPHSLTLAADGWNLRLWERAERIWAEDPELTQAHHAMQEKIRLLRRIYNVRLSHLADAYLDIDAREGPADVLDPERHAAFEAVRELDRRQVQRVAGIRREFEERYRPGDRHAVARERAEVARILTDTPVVAVDGGHVAILLNRLRLFGLAELLAGRAVVACSGGAMVLSERLVLFHDSPPWGPGHAEVAEAGLGLFPDVVVLPHAETRLRLDDPTRVSRLARRVAPAPCVLLDRDARLEWDGRRWTVARARHLTASGTVTLWEVAA